MKTRLLSYGLSLLMLAACADKAPSPPVNQDKQLVHAHLYRMFQDIPTDQQTRYRVTQFPGQIRLTDPANIFGDLSKLPTDQQGNRVAGWTLHDGLLWRVVIDPSLVAVNLISIDLDGTISSAFDLDGDGVVDILDNRQGIERASLVNEIGREFFEQWLNGRNPLCDSQAVAGLTIPAFGCDHDGAAGGGSSVPVDPGISDPFAEMCADYRSNGYRPSPPVMSHGHGYGSRMRWGWQVGHDESGRIRHTEGTRYYTDEEGNHVATYKTITYYNDEGDVTRVIQERVDDEGHGTRTVTDHGEDGTTKTESETFETELDENGDYGPSPDAHEHAPEQPPSSGSDTSNPGPGGEPGADPEADLAAWCEATQPRESGAERAAATNPSDFSIGCDDIVRSSAGGDCVVFEWARPENLGNVVEFRGNGCGPFEEPGADGTCGATNAIERLRGRTAWVGSINLQTVEICNPLVCRPPEQ